MEIFLKDGSALVLDENATCADVAMKISEGLFRNAVCAKINEVSAEMNDEHFQKTKFRIRGNGFFLNSIDHAVKTMRDGGVNVNYNTCETENETVLTLTIPKK